MDYNDDEEQDTERKTAQAEAQDTGAVPDSAAEQSIKSPWGQSAPARAQTLGAPGAGRPASPWAGLAAGGGGGGGLGGAQPVAAAGAPAGPQGVPNWAALQQRLGAVPGQGAPAQAPGGPMQGGHPGMPMQGMQRPGGGGGQYGGWLQQIAQHLAQRRQQMQGNRGGGMGGQGGMPWGR